jgi:hypothetical protein
MSIDGDARILRLTGCPCGCLPGEPCVTERPAPMGGHCPCAALTVDQLVKPEALKWHIEGHPRWVA